MTVIHTIICFAYVGCSMIALTPFGFIVVLFSLLGLRRPMSFLMGKVACYWARILLLMSRCEIIVTGMENIPRGKSICFVSNHCSYVDIVLLLAYAGRTVGFIAKKELLLIPILNIWISVLGGLFIDRKNTRKALHTINKGVQRIKKGQSMLIFPEGHRSLGRGLLPFHPGSLKLATQAEACIIPVALKGTYEVFERQYRVIPSQVKVCFCTPINTAEIPHSDRKQVLSDRIFSVIEDALKD